MSQATGALGQTTSYTYDPNGNLIVVTDPLANVTGAAYDPLNCLIGTINLNRGVTAYGYDPQSRLASVTDPRGLVTSYAHDGLDDVDLDQQPGHWRHGEDVRCGRECRHLDRRARQDHDLHL